MSEKITKADLDRQLIRLNVLCSELGLSKDDCELVMQTGSRTGGRAFRLYWQNRNGKLDSAAFGLPDGFLGLSKRQAWERISTILWTLWTVQDYWRVESVNG